jgi:hypothetical protein
MFGNKYYMSDPLNGRDTFDGFPTNARLHLEDWKPISGENAWAAIIGPLQTAYIKTGGKIVLDSQEVILALSILPAIKAMQSPIGAIYLAPEGTADKDPREISNENNLSMLAGLRMLGSVARENNDHELSAEIRGITDKIEDYFKRYGFDKKERIFYQGGFYIEGKFVPSKKFAVDCQTWGAIILGSGWIDEQFGEGTAFKIWEKTKERAGYYENGIIRGVGFTDGHDILSSEWSFGAVLMANLMSSYYKAARPDRSEALTSDAWTMRKGIETLRVNFPDGSASYKYTNKRYYVTFGWWANPIPSLASSAWAIMIHNGFNPFILGGK